MLTGYRFRPGWLTTLVFAVLLPILIGLGFWQLERAAVKTEIRDTYTARGRMDPVDVNRQALDPGGMDYRRATARGRYRGDLTIYLDNKVLDGVPGYEVLTPLDIAADSDGERFILVNRGWVPWGESRRTLPEIDTPPGALELSGRLRAPARDYFTLADETDTGEFQPLWQNLDLERYERVAGLPVSPLVLELDPGEQGAGGFVRRWRDYDDAWIDRHKAYAVQWFALALTLVVLYVALNMTKRNPEHE